MNVQAVQQSIERYGIPATVHDLAYRAVNKVMDLIVLKGIKLTVSSLDPKMVSDSAGMQWRFADHADLTRSLRQGAGDDMDVAFIDEALHREDRCYAAFDGDTLASYGWYSTRPTPVNDDLMLHFNPRWSYMYKGYTHPAYRGKRLHGIGMGRACQALTDEGLLGLVSYVKSNNFASLKSCYRLGYEDFGVIMAAKIGDEYRSWATKGCAAHDFRVEAVERSPLEIRRSVL
jgi:hypothetical protein